MRRTAVHRYLWRQDLSAFVPARVVTSGGTHSSFIAGTTVVGRGRALGIESPSDAQTVTDMREVDLAEVNDAVQFARRSFATARNARNDASRFAVVGAATVQQRAQLLRAFAGAIRRRSEVLAQADALSCGMCLADARVSVEGAASCFETIATLLEEPTCRALAAAPVPLDWSATHESRTTWAPVGVVAVVTPFNFPLEMFAWKAAPALAAGNAVVWKPPEAAPLSSFVVMDIVRELMPLSLSPLGGGVLQIVQGGPTVGAALASHMDVDLIAFTGSGRVGRAIQIAAAQSNLKRVQLELGGNGCVVVGASALEAPRSSSGRSEDAAAPMASYQDAIQIAMQCFANSGQSCTSCRRVYVPRAHAVRFAKDVAAATSKRKLGHALDPSVEQGPLISAAALDRAMSAVQEASCLPGVALVSGGFQPSFPAGYFMAPTVLYCTDPHAGMVKEELFAPVLCVIPYDGTSALDGVALANDSSVYGLSAVVVSNDVQEIESCTAYLSAGTVWVNCVDAMSGATPFGGWKQSGYGKDLGVASLEGYSNQKTITAMKKAPHNEEGCTRDNSTSLTESVEGSAF